MNKKETAYWQPDTMEKMEELLGRLTDKSVILAGGTDLLIKIRERQPEIDGYLSLCRLKELKKIEEQDGFLKIGAMVTHTQAAENSLIQKYFRALSMACLKVGSQQVRNKGTLAGNIMNGSVAGDMIPCIWNFHGELEFLSPQGYERIHIKEYLEKGGKKWAGCQKLLTAIYLPLNRTEEGSTDSCFYKLGSRTEVTIAQISLCAVWKNKKGRKTDVELVMGAVDTMPVNCSCGELLEGAFIEEDRAEKAAQMLREQIYNIRQKRIRQPKLKITEAEKIYKERAVKGLLYDVTEDMNQRTGGKE